MSPKVASRALEFLLLLFIFANPAAAQQNAVALSGTIKSPSGAPVADAKVSVKNAATGQSANTQTDATGHYAVPNLPPGDYEISISAEGYSTNISKVTIDPGVNKTADVTLGGVLSLGDLGFSQSQTQGDPKQQALLDKRSHMLKMHQRFGLITTGPLIATVIAGGLSGGHSTSSTNRDIHAALGTATVGLYLTTAYYAIFAPKPVHTPTRGSIRLHKALALIHGPGMILTPILGEMAFQQKSNGQKVHGIASLHGPVAIITAGAFGAAIMAVSFKF